MNPAIAAGIVLVLRFALSGPPKPGSAAVLRDPVLSAANIPDVFAAHFLAAIDRGVGEAIRRQRSAGDYISDEGSRWSSMRRKSILEQFLDLPLDSPGRLRAEAFLRDQGDPDHTLSEREKERFAALVARVYFRAWARAVRRASPRSRYVGGRFSSPPLAAVLTGMREGLLTGAGDGQ